MRYLIFLLILAFYENSLQAEGNYISDYKVKKTNSLEAGKKIKTIKQYYSLMDKINTAIDKIPSFGYLWVTKGMLYFSDYKFNDGFVKADYKKAEKCFVEAIKNGSSIAYYLLASTLLKQEKINDAITVLSERLKEMRKNKPQSKIAKKDYLMLSRMFSSVILKYRLTVPNAQKAITYSFDEAYKNNDAISQMNIGLLYKFLNKNKQEAYFLYKACENIDQPVEVKDFCNNQIKIIKKEKINE